MATVGHRTSIFTEPQFQILASETPGALGVLVLAEILMWEQPGVCLREKFLAQYAYTIRVDFNLLKAVALKAVELNIWELRDGAFHSNEVDKQYAGYTKRSGNLRQNQQKTDIDSATDSGADSGTGSVPRQDRTEQNRTDLNLDLKGGVGENFIEPLRIDLPRIKLTEHQFLHLMNWFDHNEKALAEACEAASDHLSSKGEFTKDPEAYMRGWKRRGEKFDRAPTATRTKETNIDRAKKAFKELEDMRNGQQSGQNNLGDNLLRLPEHGTPEGKNLGVGRTDVARKL